MKNFRCISVILLLILLLSLGMIASASTVIGDVTQNSSTVGLFSDNRSITMYPSARITGSTIQLEGPAVTVTSSNYSSYVNYLYMHTDGKVYQFKTLDYTAPVSGAVMSPTEELFYTFTSGKVQLSNAYEIVDNDFQLNGTGSSFTDTALQNMHSGINFGGDNNFLKDASGRTYVVHSAAWSGGQGNVYGNLLTLQNTPATYSWKFKQVLLSSVSYDSKGGSSVPTQYSFYGKTVTSPTAPIKEFYTFKGWRKV